MKVKWPLPSRRTGHTIHVAADFRWLAILILFFTKEETFSIGLSSGDQEMNFFNSYKRRQGVLCVLINIANKLIYENKSLILCRNVLTMKKFIGLTLI